MPRTAQEASSDPSVIRELRRMADQIRVKIHLAGMDAKDTWAKLEPKLREIEHKAEAARDQLGDDVKKAGAELQRQMKELYERLSKD